MTARRHASLAVATALVLAACEGSGRVGVDLERMIRQERHEPYEPTDLFDDGRVMRTPPVGTLPRERVLGDPALVAGLVDGKHVARIPIPVTRVVLERGRNRFDIFCAACHGIRGDGDSVVAKAMTLRKPPSLVDGKARAFPPGRIYEVIARGYGLMRAHDRELAIEDRWAVVAYVTALQRSQASALDTLPEALRARALTELP